ncbi:MAG: GDP-mannose 4,6-dehydratase [Alphaproteobacteria bacterium]|nr:GDP-mannose 4,6-dehydratase [Alphaproteobacteria bacterium]
MKKYLVTGINGFVGKHFVDFVRAIEPGSDIMGLVLSVVSKLKDIKYKSLNLCDEENVYNIVAEYKPDYIVHLAAVSSVAKSWEDPRGCFLNNNAAFLNLADAIRKTGFNTRILSVGSSEEYGIYDKPMNENFVLHPKSPYSVARLSQEYLSKLYVDRFGLDIVMTRSFNHIGPGQSTQFVVASFISQLVNIADKKSENKMMVGNIDVARDFTDVRDVVDAYHKILTKAPNRQVYNVCSGVATKLRDIIDITAKKLNVVPNIVVDKSRLRSNEIMSVVGDNTKIKLELGWKPKYTLEQTISDIISNQRS